MDVTVDIKGETTETVTLDGTATYGELLEAVDLSVHEATPIVDGRPVPADQPVDTETVTVVQLVKGG